MCCRNRHSSADDAGLRDRRVEQDRDRRHRLFLSCPDQHDRGVRDIEPIFFEVGHNYGANRVQMFRHVIIPGALPIIFAGLRLSLGTALIVIIAAEFVAAKYGLGYLIWFSWQTLLTENMFAGLVVIMVLGALFTSGLQAVEKWLMPWQREERPTSVDASDVSSVGTNL